MEPLYYQTPYVKEFDAIVTACRPAKHGFEVELSQTGFYPEGGGQPSHTVGPKILPHKKYLTFDKSNPFQAVPLSIARPSGELITARCPEPGTCVWLDQNRLCWPLSSGAPDSGAFMPRCS